MTESLLIKKENHLAIVTNLACIFILPNYKLKSNSSFQNKHVITVGDNSKSKLPKFYEINATRTTLKAIKNTIGWYSSCILQVIFNLDYCWWKQRDFLWQEDTHTENTYDRLCYIDYIMVNDHEKGVYDCSQCKKINVPLRF